MQRLYAVLLLLVSVLSTGCDSGPVDEPGNLAGTYDLAFVRSTISGRVAFEGTAGVYTDQVFTFGPGDAFSVDYLSDLDEEEGRAQGKYVIESGALVLRVASSATPLYPAGTTVRYDNFELLGSGFRTTTGGEAGQEFRGPGLVLRNQKADEYDLDRDGNRTELVTEEEYYISLGQKAG